MKEDDRAFFCESERKWYHIECDEVSEEEYEAHQETYISARNVLCPLKEWRL